MKVEFALLNSNTSITWTPESELFAHLEKYADYLAPSNRVHIANFSITDDDLEVITFNNELAALLRLFGI